MNPKASDNIITCPTCKRYAKSIGGTDSDEIFNAAWLRVREVEIKFPDKEIKDYRSYFHSALRSAMVDTKRKSTPYLFESQMAEGSIVKLINESQDEVTTDKWDFESTVLMQWLQHPTADKTIRYLKKVVTLALESKTLKEAAKRLKVTDRYFYTLLKNAEKEIEYEHFKIVDCHPFNNHDLV